MSKKPKTPHRPRGGQTQHRVRRGKPRAAAPAKPAVQVRQHPLFGAIPMLPLEVQLGDGRVHRGLDYDPDYQPPLPRGAVRGDVRRQEFCRMCHVPRYFYLDKERRCVQCGDDFIFSAAEQKHWIEVLKFHFDAEAVRCLSCRRQRRSDKALRGQLAAAKVSLAQAPDDPARQLAVVEAVVRHYERRGQGKLDEAIALARKVRQGERWAGQVESLFWEAGCHRLAGRGARAIALYREFIEHGGRGRRRTAMVKEATAWLSQLETAS